MDNLAIVIPAYNEEKRIANTLKNYSEYFDKLSEEGTLDYEILVVINNTKDKTSEIVADFSKNNPRIKYLNLIKGGKGYAVIEGFKCFLGKKNEFIGFVDADCSTPPEAMYFLVKNMNGYDGAIASRYIKGSVVIPKPTPARILSSRIFNSLIKALLFLNYQDTQCGAKVFRQMPLKKVLPMITFSKWAFDVDMLYSFKKLGFRIKELPTKWSHKEYSKINFMKSGPWMALAILRIRLLNSPLKFTIRFYDRILTRIWNLNR